MPDMPIPADMPPGILPPGATSLGDPPATYGGVPVQDGYTIYDADGNVLGYLLPLGGSGPGTNSPLGTFRPPGDPDPILFPRAGNLYEALPPGTPISSGAATLDNLIGASLGAAADMGIPPFPPTYRPTVGRPPFSVPDLPPSKLAPFPGPEIPFGTDYTFGGDLTSTGNAAFPGPRPTLPPGALPDPAFQGPPAPAVPTRFASYPGPQEPSVPAGGDAPIPLADPLFPPPREPGKILRDRDGNIIGYQIYPTPPAGPWQFFQGPLYDILGWVWGSPIAPQPPATSLPPPIFAPGKGPADLFAPPPPPQSVFVFEPGEPAQPVFDAQPGGGLAIGVGGGSGFSHTATSQ